MHASFTQLARQRNQVERHHDQIGSPMLPMPEDARGELVACIVEAVKKQGVEGAKGQEEKRIPDSPFKTSQLYTPIGTPTRVITRPKAAANPGTYSPMLAPRRRLIQVSSSSASANNSPVLNRRPLPVPIAVPTAIPTRLLASNDGQADSQLRLLASSSNGRSAAANGSSPLLVDISTS